MTPQNHTANLVQQVKAGNAKARADLLAHASRRLEELAHWMLEGYAAVRRYEQTGDVLQNALLRLSSALETVELDSVSHFYRLAALEIRRELIDLARHYTGRQGLARNHDTDDHDPETGALARQPARTGEPSSVAEWREVHEAVQKLPPELRDVIDLHVYQGLTQAVTAAILGVDQRTVRRRLHEARHRLAEKFPR